MDPTSVVVGISSVVGLLVILGGSYAILRSQVSKADMELLEAGNRELRAQRDEQKAEIAELRGQVIVLKSNLARDIGKEVAKEVANHLRGKP